jgi:hypothetical protein
MEDIAKVLEKPKHVQTSFLVNWARSQGGFVNASLSHPAMRFTALGSTGVLKQGQCQNDIWVTRGEPGAEVQGDTRIIVQSVNPMTGVVYMERWSNHEWVVHSMPASVVAQMRVNGQYFNINRGVINNNAIVNPNRDAITLFD